MITDEHGFILHGVVDVPLLRCGCHMKNGKWETICKIHEPALREYEALAREMFRRHVLKEGE